MYMSIYIYIYTYTHTPMCMYIYIYIYICIGIAGHITIGSGKLELVLRLESVSTRLQLVS